MFIFIPKHKCMYSQFNMRIIHYSKRTASATFFRTRQTIKKPSKRKKKRNGRKINIKNIKEMDNGILF